MRLLSRGEGRGLYKCEAFSGEMALLFAGDCSDVFRGYVEGTVYGGFEVF